MNNKIKNYSKEKRIPLWKVADKLKISPSTFCIKLRYQLDKETEDKILQIIDEIYKEER